MGWLGDLAQDLRYGARALRRAPTFTVVAVLTLALGIGASTAIFSVVNAVLLRPLPYPESDRLVRFIEHLPAGAESLGYPQRLATIRTTEMPTFRSQATTLSHVGTYETASMILAGRGEPLRVDVTRLSPAVVAMLGVPARLGRTFDDAEEKPGSDAVVVLGHSIWQRHFASSPDILGESLTLVGRTYSVIGVMPEGFQFPDPDTQLWIPYTLSGVSARVAPIARIADGVSLATASAEVAGILRQLQTASAPPTAKVSTFEVVRLHEELVAPLRPALVALAVSVALMLLIACVNVANLLLARTTARQREIAVRLALGAGRGRLARQLFTESLLLAIAGAAAGTMLAVWGLQVLRLLGTPLSRRDLTPAVSVPRLTEIAIDLPALAFTLGVALLAGLLFSLAPVTMRSRARYNELLHEGMASAASGFSLLQRYRMQGLLVVAEISLAMPLLVAGGLLTRSFNNLTHVDPGYDPGDVLTFTVASVGTWTPSTFNDEFIARVNTLPGVQAVGYAEILPMARFRSGGPLRPAQPVPGIGRPSPIDFRFVSRDFLAAMGMRIIEGRGFTESDGADAPRVLLINRTLARSGYLGPMPVGTTVYPTALNVPWEIIGIVDDVRQYGLDQEPDAQVFIDARQLPMGNPNPCFAVRAGQNPMGLVTDIRAITKQLNPAAMMDNIATMEQVVSNSLSRPRLLAVLFGIFAAIAGGLAAIAVYGIIAYSVERRTREIGLRLALGATRSDVIRLVLGQTCVVTAVGIGVGIAGATAGSRYLDTMLFGVKPLDPITFIGVATLFVTAAMFASFIPARRAAKIDPTVALRSE